MKRTFTLLHCALFLSMIIAGIGCDSSTEPAQDGVLSMTAVYSSAPAKRSVSKTGSAAEISITRARFVIRDIKFKSAQEDSLSFKTAPFVLELNLSGAAQTISSIPAKFGDFRRVEFDVHRVEQPIIAALPAQDQPPFADFLEAERYSIIIEGTYTPDGGSPRAFIYRSKIDAKQKLDMDPPLVIDEGSTNVNTTILISSTGWFRDQQGNIVDPANSNNEGIIDENLKSSIRVFKDNNKDGSKD